LKKEIIKKINNPPLVSVELPHNMQTRSCSEAKGFGGVFASKRSEAADTLTKDSVIVHANVLLLIE